MQTQPRVTPLRGTLFAATCAPPAKQLIKWFRLFFRGHLAPLWLDFCSLSLESSTDICVFAASLRPRNRRQVYWYCYVVFWSVLRYRYDCPHSAAEVAVSKKSSFAVVWPFPSGSLLCYPGVPRCWCNCGRLRRFCLFCLPPLLDFPRGGVEAGIVTIVFRQHHVSTPVHARVQISIFEG